MPWNSMQQKQQQIIHSGNNMGKYQKHYDKSIIFHALLLHGYGIKGQVELIYEARHQNSSCCLLGEEE